MIFAAFAACRRFHYAADIFAAAAAASASLASLSPDYFRHATLFAPCRHYAFAAAIYAMPPLRCRHCYATRHTPPILFHYYAARFPFRHAAITRHYAYCRAAAAILPPPLFLLMPLPPCRRYYVIMTRHAAMPRCRQRCFLLRHFDTTLPLFADLIRHTPFHYAASHFSLSLIAAAIIAAPLPYAATRHAIAITLMLADIMLTFSLLPLPFSCRHYFSLRHYLFSYAAPCCCAMPCRHAAFIAAALPR